MAKPILLPPAFDGMFQDFPRNALPKGRCWGLVDYIPQALGAPATERGGWSYASADISVVDATAASVRAGLEAPFTAGTQLVVIDDLGNLIKIVGGANTKIGAAGLPLQNPFLHQQTVVIPSPDGTTAPQKYDGSGIAALSATAPAGKYGCVFVNYTWLGGTAANPYRGFASPVGDPTGTWATSGTSASTLDVSFPIKAMAALPNVMLWFGEEQTARIRGTTPPPGTDMQLDDPIFRYGCLDARSVAVNGSFASFANATGVFITNGTNTPEDMTKSCGLSKYWRDLMSTYTSSWTVAAGWFGTILVVTVMNGTTLVDTIAFDTSRRAAYRFSNLKAACYFAAGTAGQELYAGSRAAARVLQLSTMWTPGSSLKADADGTAVTAVWESPFYDTQQMNTQRWRWVYLEYDLRDAATDNPTYTIAVATSPESGAAYTTLSPTLAETTKRTIVRVPVSLANTGMAFKVTRTNAAALAKLFGLGAVVYSREKVV